ncbi:hypothetical protein TBLA_0I02220 [Henningerozyma blattae CBS 6284]|uniref:Pyridoxal phosphate homeostasis protein n=1 Tax=Henningerozyma blattae (strain ATCC 34711 / CBS 6284 / DSM 70876 / NBRC 10599 / NRRL Y-10934 / UCD 77-7) TaxID=1071380 RepID=I2H928_HENB6|nr:hypothetical protein TBLA_0I02220 [Tetrapisispora blattae CBS 6284]CCH62880.1 hypothetical protein TBLA_0I02220 [Tetrapisispora blattae CBS 6284]
MPPQASPVANHTACLAALRAAAIACGRDPSTVSLLPVSKYHPSSAILALHSQGIREFGENYVQELESKAAELPSDINWHFIGTLQSGKCKDLCRIENLSVIETVDSLSKATKLNNQRAKHWPNHPITCYLQVNTSDEPQKAGIPSSDLNQLQQLVEFFSSPECTTLRLAGLMTIGSRAASTADGLNPDFTKLSQLRNALNEKYGLDLQLSMGMSNDYKQAIAQGSNEVRIGTDIFGQRPTST